MFGRYRMITYDLPASPGESTKKFVSFTIEKNKITFDVCMTYVTNTIIQTTN